MQQINRQYGEQAQLFDAQPLIGLVKHAKGAVVMLCLSLALAYSFFITVMSVGDWLSEMSRRDLVLAKAFVHAVFGSWAIILSSLLTIGLYAAMHTHRRNISDLICVALIGLGVFGYWFVLVCSMGRIAPDVPSLSVVALLIVCSVPGAWAIYKLPRTLRARCTTEWTLL